MTAMDGPPLTVPVDDEELCPRARIAELEELLVAAHHRNGDLLFQRDAARETVEAQQDEIQALKLAGPPRPSYIANVQLGGAIL